MAQNTDQKPARPKRRDPAIYAVLPTAEYRYPKLATPDDAAHGGDYKVEVRIHKDTSKNLPSWSWMW